MYGREKHIFVVLRASALISYFHAQDTSHAARVSIASVALGEQRIGQGHQGAAKSLAALHGDHAFVLGAPHGVIIGDDGHQRQETAVDRFSRPAVPFARLDPLPGPGQPRI